MRELTVQSSQAPSWILKSASAVVCQRQQRPSEDTTPESFGGSIVFIGSIVTHVSTTVQHISACIASKAAVRGLAKHSATELAPHGIRVTRCRLIRDDGYGAWTAGHGARVGEAVWEGDTIGWVGYPSELKGSTLLLCVQGGMQGGWARYTKQDRLIDG